MSVSVHIRAVTLRDITPLSELACPLALTYIAFNFSEEAKMTLLDSLSSQSFEHYIQQGYQYHVAEIDNIIMGMIGIRDNQHLYHLFINDQYQQRGIATQLWIVARDVSMKNGNTGAFTVNASINAKVVYEKFGFVAQSDALERNGITFIPMKLCQPALVR